MPLFGWRKTVTLERRLIQITNVKRAFSLCNSGVISNIKWDTQLQYLESLLGFIFIRHRLTLVHFLCSVCEIYVVISSYICITRIPVLPHELYPFRSFYSSWIKGYTGNLGRSELNWIDVSRIWRTNPKIVAIESWGTKKAKTLYQLTDAFDFRANFCIYWYLLWSSFVSVASLKCSKFLLITTRIKTFTSLSLNIGRWFMRSKSFNSFHGPFGARCLHEACHVLYIRLMGGKTGIHNLYSLY